MGENHTLERPLKQLLDTLPRLAPVQIYQSQQRVPADLAEDAAGLQIPAGRGVIAMAEILDQIAADQRLGGRVIEQGFMQHRALHGERQQLALPVRVRHI